MPDITLYSQRDARWRNKELAPGYSFGLFGHLTTCIAMIASLAGYTDIPPEVAKKLWAVGIYVGRFISVFDNIPSIYPNLAWHGELNWKGHPLDIKRLKSELSIAPTILEVSLVPGGVHVPRDQHFVIAESLTKADLNIIDPWTGTRCRLLERYAIDSWDIKKAVLKALLLRPDLQGDPA